MDLIIPNGLEEIKKVFGDFTWTEMSSGVVDIDDTWERDNLVRLRNVCGTGLNIQLHRLVAPVFEKCLSSAILDAPSYTVRMLGGWAPRVKKSLKTGLSQNLSTHSWGIAFDVNWDTNPFSKKLITDLPDEFIFAFTNAGWEWGGDWKNSKDAMHFQYCTGY